MHSGHPKYRADIDGLRAIAVLSVVMFHALPKALPSGFIGVDIFFVISGFLITSIIFSGLEKQSFSFLDFYSRRVRRIFPALIVVMLASLVAGWFILLADEYRQLGKHIAGGGLFVSNFMLLGESGYFDSSATLKPMLHLWSLAIEEQFYIVWPVFLMLAWLKKWGLLYVTMLLAALSFCINIWLVGTAPASAFYLPFSRFWELMLGGLLAYMNYYRPDLNARHKNQQSAAGALLLLAGLLLIDEERSFPGFWALVPTLGAALLISAGPAAWFNRKVLSHQLAVWFGLISYPLYLWHWPLLSFLSITDENSGRGAKLLMAAFAVLLAWLTYRFVERPLRGRSSRMIPLVLLALMLLVGAAGYSCVLNNGYEGYGPRSAEKTEFSKYFENSLPEWRYFNRENIRKKFREECDFYNIELYRQGRATQEPIPHIRSSCYSRDARFEKALFVWGDSHAQQLNSGLTQRMPTNWQVLQVASSGCNPEISTEKRSAAHYCETSNRFALTKIKELHPDVVIVAQNLHHDAGKMQIIAATLEGLGVGTVIF
ncbi:MAG: acyltransferase family protein, partial [Polynucleobacter sp.]|nr:acyltransferase family protein [Polynucleobacter sp.]